jgi:hypothetical protein
MAQAGDGQVENLAKIAKFSTQPGLLVMSESGLS